MSDISYYAYRGDKHGNGYSDELSATSRDEALIKALTPSSIPGLIPVTCVAEYRGPICPGTARMGADGELNWISRST